MRGGDTKWVHESMRISEYLQFLRMCVRALPDVSPRPPSRPDPSPRPHFSQTSSREHVYMTTYHDRISPRHAALLPLIFSLLLHVSHPLDLFFHLFFLSIYLPPSLSSSFLFLYFSSSFLSFALSPATCYQLRQTRQPFSIFLSYARPAITTHIT